MPAITAIEFDGDTCAIARTSVRGGVVTVSAAELLNPTAFPGNEAFVAALRNSRRTLGLARRCRVVLWGLPDGASPRDPGAAEALAPLSAAGFKVERVVTPCNALGALARLKPLRDADSACWVAINTSGVAIVAIRPGQQIYARSFGWDSTVGSSGSQARLLQRYSLVAFLAPEVKRAMAAARAIGFPVRAVITCGNLPDLRSLTMPLIEELDVEVETLDSLDGLVVSAAPPARLTELAAAIRLACAGVVARRTRPWDISKRAAAHRTAALMRAAAGAALIAGLGGGYLLYDRWRAWATSSASPRVVATARNERPARPDTPPPAATAGRPTPPRTPNTVPSTAAAPAPNRPMPQPTTPGSTTTPARPAATPLPEQKPAPRPPPQPEPVASEPPQRVVTPPAAPSTPTGTKPSAPASAPAATAGPPAASAPPAGNVPLRGIEPRFSPVQPGPPPALLKDPLPRITAILVSHDRRFATIDGGQVVGVGDAIGRRVVVGIDERAVTLREPSGARVRIGLGGRLLSAAR